MTNVEKEESGSQAGVCLVSRCREHGARPDLANERGITSHVMAHHVGTGEASRGDHGIESEDLSAEPCSEHVHVSVQSVDNRRAYARDLT